MDKSYLGDGWEKNYQNKLNQRSIKANEKKIQKPLFSLSHSPDGTAGNQKLN